MKDDLLRLYGVDLDAKTVTLDGVIYGINKPHPNGIDVVRADDNSTVGRLELRVLAGRVPIESDVWNADHSNVAKRVGNRWVAACVRAGVDP